MDSILLNDITVSKDGLDEIMISLDINLVDDKETDWIDDRSEPEVEFEPEKKQLHEEKLTFLRVLEWLQDQPADRMETFVMIQDVDQPSIKNINHDNTE